MYQRINLLLDQLTIPRDQSIPVDLERNCKGLLPPTVQSDQHTDTVLSRNHSTGTCSGTVNLAT